MKKLILIALSSLSIISCSKDDDEKDESIITGTWNLNKVQGISGKDNSVISSQIISDCPDRKKYDFSDNKYIFTSFKDSFLVECDVLGTENGEFSYDKNQKIITFRPINRNSYIINVNSITSNELQIFDSGFGYDINGDGINDQYIMVYSK